MNVLFYQHQYPAFGGIETVTTLLARQFVKDGHRVKIVSFRHRDGTGLLEQLPDGATWQELPEERFDSAANMTALSAIFNDFVPDVVIFQDSYTNIHTLLFEVIAGYRARHKVKVFAVEHSEPLGTWRLRKADRNLWTVFCRFVKICIWPYYKRRRLKIEAGRRVEIAKFVDAYVVLADAYAKTVRELVGPVLAGRVLVIPNPAASVSAKAKGEKENVVLFVGNLSVTKGVDRMLKAWRSIERLVPGWRFRIVGDGDMRTRLELLSLGLYHVDFLGAQAEPSNYYKTASIFLSASDYEGWPMTLCEAMSHGCVPVAFDSFGALREIVENGRSGLIVSAFNIRAFSNALRKLMIDQSMLKQMSGAAVSGMASFGAQLVAQRWYELFSCSKERAAR